MSFGWSVGDVVKIVELAREVRKRFVDAPGQYKAIGNDVKNLSRIIEEIDDILPHRSLSAQQEKHLRERQQVCEDILGELRIILNQSASLEGSDTRPKDGKLRVVWKRLRWNQTEIENLRNRLHFGIDGLNLFMQNVTSEKIFEIGDHISEIHRKEQTLVKEQMRLSVLESLSTFDHVSTQQDVSKKRYPQTGEWILESNDFVDFKAGKMNTLLCHGMPGAGKTIITSIVVDHFIHKCKKDQSVGTCYFYFRYDSTKEQTMEMVLGSLTRQLLEWQTEIPDDFISSIGSQAQDPIAPFGKEVQSFLFATNTYSKVFVVLDALDEYYAGDSNRALKFLGWLTEVQRRAPIQLFVTTRANSEVIALLTPCLRTEIRARDDDVTIYINSRMSELRKIRDKPDLQAEVVRKVVQVTGGMFLLARLHMDALREPVTLGSFKKRLANLPNGAKGLNATYDEAMRRIDAQGDEKRHLARRVLSWIVYTEWVLTINELLDVIAIAYDTDASEFDKDMRPDVEDIDSLCAGLVTVDTNAKYMRLVHETTLEYFTSVNPIPGAHSEIMRVCFCILSYPISLDDYSDRFCTRANVDDDGLSPSLFSYAGRFWYTHALKAGDVWDEVFRFLLNPVSVSICMRKNRFSPWSTTSSGLGVHLTAYLGLDKLFARLLESGQAFDARDADGRTPLTYACMSGSISIVQPLLDQHILPTLRESRAFHEQPPVSVSRHTEKDILSNVYQALIEAALEGHLPVVMSLAGVEGFEDFVRHGEYNQLGNTDFSIGKSYQQDLICCAASGDHVDTVDFFLGVWGSWYDSAFPNWIKSTIVLAISLGSVESLKLLIERTMQYPSIQEALHELSEKTEKLSTTLQLIQYNEFAMLEILSHCFMEIEGWTTSQSGIAFFNRVVDTGHLALVQQFIRHSHTIPKIKPSSRKFFDAILQVKASEDGKELLDSLFSTLDIDPHAVLPQQRESVTLLEAAILEGNSALFQKIAAVSDLGISGVDNWKMLTAAMRAGDKFDKEFTSHLPPTHIKEPGVQMVADILSEHYGVSLLSRNEYGATPLMWAVSEGLNYVGFLHKQRRVNINARDAKGRTALMYASHVYTKLFPTLYTTFSITTTPLFSLLDLPSIDATTTDNEGRTALWWAISGLEYVVKSRVWDLKRDLMAQEEAIALLLDKASLTPDPRAVELARDKYREYSGALNRMVKLSEIHRLYVVDSYQRVREALVRRSAVKLGGLPPVPGKSLGKVASVVEGGGNDEQQQQEEDGSGVETPKAESFRF
ncbi:unnamed protein product [Periconia digitata]|uniref:NACHT domain-containing protein n=1 Tax=Periconia digitata TaxID=1303443 RepID=A0A9W4UNC0_9PLEO|nr:unnamed protein product [Periconia digitata]